MANSRDPLGVTRDRDGNLQNVKMDEAVGPDHDRAVVIDEGVESAASTVEDLADALEAEAKDAKSSKSDSKKS